MMMMIMQGFFFFSAYNSESNQLDTWGSDSTHIVFDYFFFDFISTQILFEKIVFGLLVYLVFFAWSHNGQVDVDLEFLIRSRKESFILT
jgi:hypothetical protein